jgi:hypothetical protein
LAGFAAASAAREGAAEGVGRTLLLLEGADVDVEDDARPAGAAPLQATHKSSTCRNVSPCLRMSSLHFPFSFTGIVK